MTNQKGWHWAERNRGKDLNYNEILVEKAMKSNFYSPGLGISRASKRFRVVFSSLNFRAPLNCLLAPGFACRFVLLFPVLCTALLVTIQEVQSGPIRAGPIVHEFPLTLMPGRRMEALGPLVHHEVSDLWKAWALSPLFSYTRDQGIEAAGWDLAYPFITYDRFGEEYSWRFLMLLSLTGGQDQAEQIQRRTTLFPIFFHQSSPDPELRYLAVFPLAGRLKNRLFRDEIRFFLFPLYGSSRRADVVTHNFLYPLFHLRKGDQLHGWQFWPLAGFEERTPAIRTNRFGDEELVAGHRKSFVLWPIHMRQDLQIGSTNPVSHRILFPLYALQRSPARDSSSYLWPLLTYTDDRERRFRELGLPWPLVVFARGEGKTVNRVWPFFSHAQSATLESEFYLWPVYRRNRVHSPPFDRERRRILFFLYSHVNERNEETSQTSRRRDLWPLFTWHEDREGAARLQLFAPVEPLLPNNRSVQRNWSPLWSVWRSERNRRTGSSSQSLLWNLYRRDAIPEAQTHSAMFGLFQYDTSRAGKRLRLFYIPLSGRRGTSASEGGP